MWIHKAFARALLVIMVQVSFAMVLRSFSPAWPLARCLFAALLCAAGSALALAGVQGSEPLPVRIEEASGEAATVGSLSPSCWISCPEGQSHAAFAVPEALVQGLRFPDGSRVVLFRGGKGSSDLDLMERHFTQDGVWSEARRIGREGWVAGEAREATLATGTVLRLPAEPVPHFSVSHSAPRASVAWYTAGDDEPRVLVSQTPDAGLRWSSGMRADLGAPEGRLATQMFSDGTLLLLWLELPQGDDPSLPGGLYLRRIAPNGGSTTPALIALVEASAIEGNPRLVLEREVDSCTGTVLVSYRGKDKVRHLRVTLPDKAALLEIDQNCRCGPAPEPGVPARLRIQSFTTALDQAEVTHRGIPGLLRSGSLRVVLEPALARTLSVGDEVLGRLQRQGEGWRLVSSVRLQQAGR